MKNHSCLHAVFVLALAMLFFACTSPPLRGLGGLGWGALKPGGVFSQADSLMNHRPDSALQLLETLLPDTNSMRKDKVCSVTEKNYDYVTKVRKRLLKKIFHIDGHAKDFDSMIMNIV